MANPMPETSPLAHAATGQRVQAAPEVMGQCVGPGEAGDSFKEPTKGDQPRFERGREGIGAAVCESAAVGTTNGGLALATLPHTSSPGRRTYGAHGNPPPRAHRWGQQ